MNFQLIKRSWKKKSKEESKKAEKKEDNIRHELNRRYKVLYDDI